MKKIIISLSFLVALHLLSCKKESTSPSTSGGSTTAPTITPSNATSWNGIFYVDKLQSISNGTVTTDYVAQAYFSTLLAQYSDPSTAVRVDTVRLNGVPLQYYDSTYNDTSGFSNGIRPPLTYPYTFKVVGKHGIPSFTYTENGPFPDYTSYSNVPDTIYRSLGVTISLAGISNADNVIVNIVQGTHEPSQLFYKPFPANVTFTASSLSSLDTTSIMSMATIEIILVKMDNKSVNGKPMAFNMGYSFTKNITIK